MEKSCKAITDGNSLVKSVENPERRSSRSRESSSKPSGSYLWTSFWGFFCAASVNWFYLNMHILDTSESCMLLHLRI